MDVLVKEAVRLKKKGTPAEIFSADALVQRVGPAHHRMLIDRSHRCDVDAANG